MRPKKLRPPETVSPATPAEPNPLHRLIREMGSLPNLPEGPLHVLRLLEKPDFSLHEVATCIARDPLLAPRVVAMANSAVYGGGRPTSSVEEAVLQLGQRETRAAVLAIGITSVLPELPAPLSPEGFWTFALGAARCAHQLADDLGYGGREEAYMGGLVHRLGEILLAASFPARYERAWVRAEQTGDDLDLCLLEEFGVSHTELCARVLLDWGLPAKIASAVRHSASPEDSSDTPILSLILWTATWLCRELGLGYMAPLAKRNRWGDFLPESMEAELRELGYEHLATFLLRRPAFAHEMAQLSGHLCGQP